MSPDAVLLETREHVARVTLNRPAVLNAMDEEWVEGLEAAVEAIAADPRVRVAILQGAGRSFCAGLDLDMLAVRGMPDGFYATQERAFRRLELMEPLAIAAIHGHCLGGGLQLAIACDLRIAARDAKFGLPAANEGLFPGMAPFRLPRLIGIGRARRLILSGEVVDAETALAYGLVDHLVEDESFGSEVEVLVERYLATPRLAAQASKRLLDSAFTSSFDESYERSVPLLERCLDSPEVAAAAEAWRHRSTSGDQT